MKFEKVSFIEWDKTFRNMIANFDNVNEQNLEQIIKESYDNIKIPRRSTVQSAGYDFIFPFENIELTKDEWITIPTGIRWCGDDCNGKVLIITPRSGLGFKKGLKLRNTIGIIDADYQYAQNEGHIMIKISVEVSHILEKNKGFAQGIILPFCITEEETVTTERKGGFGSTDN